MFSEEDVDRELNAALSVAPSPGFEARVLRRIETERRPSARLPYGWMAVAASVIVAIGVFYAIRSDRASAPPAPRIASETRVRASAPTASAPGSHDASVPLPVQAARVARRQQRPAAPQVIVSPNQMEAVRRLVRAVNEGRLEAPPQPADAPLAPTPPVGVVPIVVEPIPLSPLGPGLVK